MTPRSSEAIIGLVLLSLLPCSGAIALASHASGPLDGSAASQWIARARDVQGSQLTSEARGKASFSAVERVLMEAKAHRASLERALTAAQASAHEATTAEADAVLGFRTLIKHQGNIVAEAKKEALQNVEAFFVNRNRQLQVWRDTVLTDRYKAGQAAMQKAQQPYYDAVDSVYSRMYKASADVQAMRAEADEKQQQAAKVSGSDIKLAESLRQRSEELTEAADAAQSQVEDAYGSITNYLSGAHQAGLRAEALANPGRSPPLPIDPEMAYLPPTAVNR